MKKLIFLPSILLALGISFTSCKDNTDREERVTEIDQIGTEETGMDEIAYSEFSQYDANRDGLYDQNEFGETYESEFSNMDNDSDGNLSKEEFYASTFDLVDKDQDGSITEEEWTRGNEAILNKRAEENEFSDFDTNSDNQINREEWKKGFEESNWFTSYDSNKDKLIQQEEWDNGFFDDWDLDDDGSLSEEEFNNFSTYNEEEKEPVEANDNK